MNESESDSFWDFEGKLALGLLGIAFFCSCFFCVVFARNKNKNAQRNRTNHVQPQMVLGQSVEDGRGYNHDESADKRWVNGPEGMPSNASMDKKRNQNDVGLIDKYFAHKPGADARDISADPSCSTGSDSDIYVSVMERKDEQKNKKPPITPFRLETQREHDEEGSVTPKDKEQDDDDDGDGYLDADYLDVDQMAEDMKRTKGALSSPRNAMFKQNVNDQVMAEQVVMDDIVGDMDGGSGSEEATKPNAMRRQQTFSQMLGDNAMVQELVMEDIVDEMAYHSDTDDLDVMVGMVGYEVTPQ